MDMKNKDKKPFNKDGQKHGYWERYYSNGDLGYKGNYINDQHDGYFEVYHTSGKLHYKKYYIEI